MSEASEEEFNQFNDMMDDQPYLSPQQKTSSMEKFDEDFDDECIHQEKETPLKPLKYDFFEQERSFQRKSIHEIMIQDEIGDPKKAEEEEETGLPKKKRKDQNYIRALSRRFCDKLGETRTIQPNFKRTPATIQDLRFIMVLLRSIQRRHQFVETIYEKMKKEYADLVSHDEGKQKELNIVKSLVYEIDLNDSMDIEKNLRILRIAGKKRIPQEANEKDTEEEFLKFEQQLLPKLKVQ